MLSEKPWKLEGIIRLMAGIFVCLCFVSLLQAIVQYFVGKDAFDEGSLLYLLFSSLSLHGSILFGTGFFLWWHRLSWSEAFGFRTPPVISAILLGILAALLFLPVGMVLQDVSIKVLNWSHVETPPGRRRRIQQNYLVGQPCLSRRLRHRPRAGCRGNIFRGILYPSLKQIGQFPPFRVPDEPAFLPMPASGLEFEGSASQMTWWQRIFHGRTFALCGSSLVFAAIHHSASIFVPLFVLGIVLAWLYERTNNLLASITAHSLFNAINVVLLFVGDRLQDILDQHFHHP